MKLDPAPISSTPRGQQQVEDGHVEHPLTERVPGLFDGDEGSSTEQKPNRVAFSTQGKTTSLLV